MSAWHTGRECPLGDPAEGTDYDPEDPPEYDEWELDLADHPDQEAELATEPDDYTPAPPTLRDTWPPHERAEMAARLELLGTTITELSDAREHLGLPRLSRTASPARRYAHHLLAGLRGRAAIAAVRAERARLTAQIAHPELANHAIEARRELGLRANPASWRLGELRQVAKRAHELLRDFDEAATPLRLVRGGRIA